MIQSRYWVQMQNHGFKLRLIVEFIIIDGGERCSSEKIFIPFFEPRPLSKIPGCGCIYSLFQSDDNWVFAPTIHLSLLPLTILHTFPPCFFLSLISPTILPDKVDYSMSLEDYESRSGFHPRIFLNKENNSTFPKVMQFFLPFQDNFLGRQAKNEHLLVRRRRRWMRSKSTEFW